MTDGSTRTADIDTLRAIVLTRGDDQIVRKSAYEALWFLVKGEHLTLDDDTDLDEDLDLDLIARITDV